MSYDHTIDHISRTSQHSNTGTDSEYADVLESFSSLSISTRTQFHEKTRIRVEETLRHRIESQDTNERLLLSLLQFVCMFRSCETRIRNFPKPTHASSRSVFLDIVPKRSCEKDYCTPYIIVLKWMLIFVSVKVRCRVFSFDFSSFDLTCGSVHEKTHK